MWTAPPEQKEPEPNSDTGKPSSREQFCCYSEDLKKHLWNSHRILNNMLEHIAGGPECYLAKSHEALSDCRLDLAILIMRMASVTGIAQGRMEMREDFAKSNLNVNRYGGPNVWPNNAVLQTDENGNVTPRRTP